MLSTTRSAAALALRGTPPIPQVFLRHKLISTTVKPASSLIPYRTVAALSSTSAKPATAVEQRNATNLDGLPLSVTGKVKREVLLPSQEGKKGAMQYALYDPHPIACQKAYPS